MGLLSASCRQSRSSVLEESEGLSERAEIFHRDLAPKLAKVRDYKCKFILTLLQKEAMSENPGFRLLDEDTHRGKILWVNDRRCLRPVGYYIYCDKHWEYIRSLKREVEYPATFSQVYISREFRRNGLATLMMRDFIKNHPGLVWVESPKYETRMLLSKLGYSESSQPYELWEMVEGLSRWIKDSSKSKRNGRSMARDAESIDHGSMNGQSWALQES